MNVAFFINKRMSLKFYKDIISVLLKRNHIVFFLIIDNRRKVNGENFNVRFFQSDNSKF